jgi:hypothetical protein
MTQFNTREIEKKDDDDENEEDDTKIAIDLDLLPPMFFIKNIILLHNKSFTKNRQKKIGRIKRKIKRKLVLQNNITD